MEHPAVCGIRNKHKSGKKIQKPFSIQPNLYNLTSVNFHSHFYQKNLNLPHQTSNS